MKYQRILIKFTGEAFSEKGKKANFAKIQEIVEEIKALRKLKVKVAVVCGGGNVSRWKDVKCGDRVAVDLKGIRGTLKNVYPLEKLLKKAKVPAAVYTSFSVKSKYPHFVYLGVKRDWQRGKVLIFAGGTGHPFFTTDTAAILRALEISAQVFVKATKVDGIFTADPIKNPRAQKIRQISYKKIIADELKIIDSVAVCLAWENQLPIRIVKWEPGAIIKVVLGKNSGSTIKFEIDSKLEIRNSHENNRSTI